MVYNVCMEYGILLFLTIALAAGVAGGFLASWSCHRRLLVLEEDTKVRNVATADRFNQLEKIVVRQDKSEAAKVRWSKKEIDDAATLKQLTNVNNNGGAPATLPWDPRVWGDLK